MATKSLYLSFLILSIIYPACSAPALTEGISPYARRAAPDVPNPQVTPPPGPSTLPSVNDVTNPDPRILLARPSGTIPPISSIPSSVPQGKVRTPTLPVNKPVALDNVPLPSPPQPQPSTSKAVVQDEDVQVAQSAFPSDPPTQTDNPTLAYTPSPDVSPPSPSLQPAAQTEQPSSPLAPSSTPNPAVVTWINSQMIVAATHVASYSTSNSIVGPVGAAPTGAYFPHASPSTTVYDSDLPTPTQGPPGQSQATEQSRKAAVLGTMMAIGTLLSLLLCVLCARCHFTRRRRNRLVLPEILLNDHDKISLSSGNEKDQDSMSSRNMDRVVLPVLNSNSDQVPMVSPFQDPSPPQEWHAITTNESGTFEDVTHVLTEFPSVPDPRTDDESPNNGDAPTEDNSSSQYRTSAGTSSVAAQSYTTCESHYSEPSIGRSSQIDRISFQSSAAVIVPEPPTLSTNTTKPLVITRKRSKTVTHAASPPVPAMSSSKSFPAISMAFRSRLSDDTYDRFSRTTQGSEWDVARAYGRFSKESNVVSEGLSTIEEDGDEGELVEVSGKKCVLVKSRF